MPRSSLTPEESLALVREEIWRVVSERPLPFSEPLQPYHQLSADVGLSSGDIVELIGSIESRLALGASESLSFTELKTVEDVCRACLTSSREGADPTDRELAASLRRGQARRLRR